MFERKGPPQGGLFLVLDGLADDRSIYSVMDILIVSVRRVTLLFLFLVAFLSTLLTVFALLEPAWSDIILVSLPCALASAFLLGQLFRKRQPGQKLDLPKLQSKPVKQKPLKRVVIDGSNVMHWRDGEPSFDPLHDVIRKLKVLGFTPGVMFDANAGYLLEGRYLDDAAMAARLRLPENAVVVVEKGRPADPVILAAARDIGAVVVSNDRYRDWEADFPEIRERGFLVCGGYKSGALNLNGIPQQTS